MLTLNRNLFIQIFSLCPIDKVDIYRQNFNYAIIEGNITSILRLSAFCSQICVETNELKCLVENLNYSALLLMKTWPSRFPTTEIANKYAYQPEKLANFVYSNRLGNGDEASGEGWKYRGRGVLQSTGKNNYLEASQATGIDFVANPDLMTDPSYMFKVGKTYWVKRNINVLADKGNIDAISKVVNGGSVGLEERRAYYKRFVSILSNAILGI